MITKGIIRRVYHKGESNVYRCLVEIPLFESAGLEDLYEVVCPICYTPGNLNNYVEGDIVYVGFEDAKWGNPVILGKLYRGQEENGEQEAHNFSYANSLEVTQRAILPNDTTIGSLNFSDLYELVKTKNLDDSFTDKIAIIQSPIINFYGYSLQSDDYSAELKTTNGLTYYLIKYKNEQKFSGNEVQNYIRVMVGGNMNTVIDSKDSFKGAILFTDGRTGYLETGLDESLRLVMVNNLRKMWTKAEIENIIREYYGESTQVDIEPTQIITTTKLGGQKTDIDSSAIIQGPNTRVEIKTITPDDKGGNQ